MSVGALLGAPRARGLFARAIAQSGAASNCSTREQAERVARTFLARARPRARDAGELARRCRWTRCSPRSARR